jgi:hypothetical protein
LVQTALSAPPATKPRNTTFVVTDTVQNIGAVASGPSAMRYYLSLDPIKSANDPLLAGYRTLWRPRPALTSCSRAPMARTRCWRRTRPITASPPAAR